MERDEPQGRPGSASPSEATETGDIPPPADAEAEPDPRFTLANERTFLAWNRTALALVAAGGAAAAFFRMGMGGARLAVALPLIALGAVLAFTSYGQWKRTDRSIRLGEPSPDRSRLNRLLAWGIALVAAVTGLLAVIEMVVSSSPR